MSAPAPVVASFPAIPEKGWLASPCSFCASRATARCGWPDLKPVEIPHYHLSTDDTLVTRGDRRLPVLAVNRFKRLRRMAALSPTFRLYTVTMYAINYGQDRYFLFYRWGVQKVMVLRTAPCGKPCCEFHHRELNDGKFVCREHWDAWKDRL